MKYHPHLLTKRNIYYRIVEKKSPRQGYMKGKGDIYAILWILF